MSTSAPDVHALIPQFKSHKSGIPNFSRMYDVNSILDLADMCQDAFIMEKFLHFQANSLQEENILGHTVLHVVSMRGNAPVLAYLLNSPYIVNEHGTKSKKQKSQLLLAKLDKRGNSALHCACEHMQTASIMLLLEAGSDATIPNRFGEVPLHVFVQARIRKRVKTRTVVAIITRLIEPFLCSGAVPVTKAQETTLHCIVKGLSKPKRKAAILAHVLKNSEQREIVGSLSDKDKAGKTVLEYAVQNRERAVVAALLLCGADVQLKHKKYESLRDKVQSLLRTDPLKDKSSKRNRTQSSVCFREASPRDPLLELLGEADQSTVKNKAGRLKNFTRLNRSSSDAFRKPFLRKKRSVQKKKKSCSAKQKRRFKTSQSKDGTENHEPEKKSGEDNPMTKPKKRKQRAKS
eukprot:TRINITY_DN18804_c0_g1_i1.p1 TRINITY_DN18804_c0_g1~~TRINITY_DN18804_c0_g1_i1.p1  ORF type:complete len:405 (+),score=56.41 TRINITY_DN18804_c0_g1_i1:759-1973(+)